jgi:hypothetical protein
MEPERDVASEIAYRIQADVDHFGGTMPERTALAWRGYLAAILEWNLIPLDQYEQLLARIPVVDDDPSVVILRGRD